MYGNGRQRITNGVNSSRGWKWNSMMHTHMYIPIYNHAWIQKWCKTWRCRHTLTHAYYIHVAVENWKRRLIWKLKSRKWQFKLTFKCMMFAGFGGQGVCCPRVCGLDTRCVGIAQNTHTQCHTQSYCTIAISTCAFTLWNTPLPIHHLQVVDHCLKQAELVITVNTPHTTHHTHIVPHCVTYKIVSLEVDTHWGGCCPRVCGLGNWWSLLYTKHITPQRTPKTAQRHGRLHPSLMEGKDTLHSSPSQTSGLLSAATAPPLTTGAELETPNASTVPSLPIKAHPSTLLAGGWSGRAPSGDRFLRQDSPGDKQGQESKQGWVVLGLWAQKYKIDNSDPWQWLRSWGMHRWCEVEAASEG